MRCITRAAALACVTAATLVSADTVSAAGIFSRLAQSQPEALPAPVVPAGSSTIIYQVEVCHPGTGCKHVVDLCLPCCCTGAPCVTQRCTLIGCGLVRYDWCCGCTVVIRFDRCGGYRVIYRC